LAASLPEVAGVVRFAGEAAGQGSFVVLTLAYEAAGAFDERLAVHASPKDGFPLAFAAAYAAPMAAPMEREFAGEGGYAASSWWALISREEYGAALSRIREYLRLGESYQVNYTAPFECDFTGDDLAWFRDLAGRQEAGYAAYLDLGRQRVLCFSPELFFSRQGDEVAARPMKGTSRRGRTRAEDARLAAALADCPKNRAENVMITDMLRNDLGRLAVPGSVGVSDLFTVERYRTVLQMTSTVRARLAPGTGLFELLRAVFPCASVTGAPKVRTMEIIRELEPHPRGVYCGAIGLLAPGGDCEFCVPIRTVSLDAEAGRARFGAGGGVTFDSREADEYEECLIKMGFLSGEPAFELLETLLLAGGEYYLMAGHLARLRESAAYFGFPWDEAGVSRVLDAARGSGEGRFRVRLLLAKDGRARTEVFALAALPGVMRVGLAGAPVDSGDRFLFHKTTRREVYERARAGLPDCDDVILYNRDGFVTESSIANVVVSMGGELCTPPVGAGLLPGVFREELIKRGLVAERDIRAMELAAADSVWLVNSVRGFMPARLIPAQD